MNPMQSPNVGPGGKERKWLWPHLEGGWHLLDFVPLEELRKLAYYTADRVHQDY